MTTNSQYHWKEYKVKEYGPIKNYNITNKPKYHEYKSYHEYDKVKEYKQIRNYDVKEYKPKRMGYHGYRPEARLPKEQKERLLPKREREYNKMRWFRQIKHCYRLPMGPEYPVNVYKPREYRRKKEQLDYHEYNSYKPFKGYQQYNGSVYYKLTPLNYYGYRRGKRIYRPVTPQPFVYPLAPVSEPVYPQQTLIKPAEKEHIIPEPVKHKPLSPAPETVYPQQVILQPAIATPVVLVAKEPKVYQPTIRDDNGFYKLNHPVGYHGYESYHEYNPRYRQYRYKPYNHIFLYTSKDSPDEKPHIVKREKEIGHKAYPEYPRKVTPQSVPPPQKWRPPYAKEERLRHQILIMPTPKPATVKSRKKIPNARETVYPSQTLIEPITIVSVVAKEPEPETVVRKEEARPVQRARVAPVVLPLIFEEESQVVIAPVAAKRPRYVPTVQPYAEESVVVTAPPPVKTIPPIQPAPIVQKQQPEQVVQVAAVPLVASAPPVNPAPRYQSTTVPYEEESLIVTMPASVRQQKEIIPAVVPIPVYNSAQKQPPVTKVQSHPETPIPQPRPVPMQPVPVIQQQIPQPKQDTPKTVTPVQPKLKTPPIQPIPVKPDTPPRVQPNPIMPLQKPLPIIVPVVAAVPPRKLPDPPKKDPPPSPPAQVNPPKQPVEDSKPVIPLKIPPKPVTPPKKQSKPIVIPVITPQKEQTKPVVTEPPKPIVNKEQPKPVKPPIEQPIPVVPEQLPKQKPVIGDIANIPPFKPNEPESKPVVQLPKPVVQPPKPVVQPPKPVVQPPKPVEPPVPKPVEQPKPVMEPVVEKSKYIAQPVKPPQPRRAPPTSKPPPKPVESKPEPVVSNPEPDERPPTPRTPPKQRVPIRRPSLQRSPSPPLPIPTSKQKTPKKDSVPVEAPMTNRQMLGALGTVKRTLYMMG